MRLTSMFVMLMAVLALFLSSGDAAPSPAKVDVKALKNTGKAIKKGVSAVSAVATAHELYKGIKNHGRQG